MPELPEIETICQALKPKILNQIIIEAIRITNLKLRQEIPADIEQSLHNRTIVKISRIAKYISIYLDNNLVIIMHLGMSGKVLIKPESYIYKKHDHFSIKFKNGQQLVYNDPRRFGLITLCKEDELSSCSLLKHLGVEPLGPDFTVEYLSNILAKKKQPIKLTIMDNQNIVGVGNIYALESLFLSNILPTRPSYSINKEEVKSLRDNIVDVLNQAISQGGSSIKDYSSVSGENGYFQNSFKVYGRVGKECTSCGANINKITQAGRSSFYCSCCQK